MKIKNRGANYHWAAASDSADETQQSTDLNLCARWQLPSSKCDHPNWHWGLSTNFGSAQKQRDIALKETTLKMIAELHLSWFEYPSSCLMKNARLSKKANQNQSRPGNISSTTGLHLWTIKQYQPAEATTSKILSQWTTVYSNTCTAVRDRLRLRSPCQLVSAFQTKRLMPQLGHCSSIIGDALVKLVALYRSQGQIDEALETSQFFYRQINVPLTFTG